MPLQLSIIVERRDGSVHNLEVAVLQQLLMGALQ